MQQLKTRTKSLQIEEQKIELRKNLRLSRSLLDEETRKRVDNGVFQNLISMFEFKGCGYLLTYVSVGEEVDTRAIISYALLHNKTVAVPRCIPSENKLEFYRIESLDELKQSRFGLLEPDADPDKKVEKSLCGLCLVPGLSFDRFGNRLGYGGGYYDRYLERFSSVTIGLCRSHLLSEEKLPCDFHDKQVKLILTEREIIRPDCSMQQCN